MKRFTGPRGTSMISHFASNALIIIISVFFLEGCVNNQQTQSYYLNIQGSDSNTGTSPENAWQSIAKLNSASLKPGDHIYFMSEQVFIGNIVLKPGNKGISLGSYGGGIATISGGNDYGLIADQCNLLKICGLKFSGSGRKNGNSSDGLYITNCDSVAIDSVEISGFQHSGIHLHICSDVSITNAYTHDNGFAGIHVTGTTAWDSLKYDNRNIYIANCTAENNPGDPTIVDNHSGNGIIASSTSHGMIEYCEAMNNGWDMQWNGNGPVGIWIWDCTDFVIQHCISHHNRTAPGAADGGGFDLDGGVSNSVIQFCVSYKNEGAGFGLYEFGAKKPWQNNVIRYNISLDDGITNSGSVGIWKGDNGGTIRNCDIYNNTFYNLNQKGYCIWLHNNYPGFRFMNNVFVYRGSMVAGHTKIKDEYFLNNLYWNPDRMKSIAGYSDLADWAKNTGKEMKSDSLLGLFCDPMFSVPDNFKIEDPNSINIKNLAPFYPAKGSPLINSALDLKVFPGLDPGPSDLCGTAVPGGGKYDLGALEYVEE
jgi:hypothetical protein